MAYQANKPAATDRLKDSQSDIQGNFSAIKTLIDVNHGTFGDPNQGYHTVVTIPPQGGGTPVPPANMINIYADTSTLTSVTELFINRDAGSPVEFTSSTQATNGWTRLPSGILIKWGTDSATRNTLSTITFPTGATIPAFTSIFSVTGSQTFSAGPSNGDLNTAPCIGNFTTTTFQVYPRANGLPNGGTVSIAYVAIGI